jgi:hypothetical protein
VEVGDLRGWIFWKFKKKGGIMQGKPWESQHGATNALKCVFYR